MPANHYNGGIGRDASHTSQLVDSGGIIGKPPPPFTTIDRQRCGIVKMRTHTSSQFLCSLFTKVHACSGKSSLPLNTYTYMCHLHNYWMDFDELQYWEWGSTLKVVIQIKFWFILVQQNSNSHEAQTKLYWFYRKVAHHTKLVHQIKHGSVKFAVYT
jgi:hypothetical protein